MATLTVWTYDQLANKKYMPFTKNEKRITEEVRLIYTMDRYQLKEARHLGAIARMQPERYERAKETIDRIMDTLRQ